MTRRLPSALVVVLLVGAACTGLYFDQSNAFPCDFSQGLGLRDQACVPGDACGSNNLCGPYIYEGPRFEGAPVLPDFSGEFVTLHPQVLDVPVVGLATTPIGERGELLVLLEDGRVTTLSGRQSVDKYPFPEEFKLNGGLQDAVVGTIAFTVDGGRLPDKVSATIGRLAPAVGQPTELRFVVNDAVNMTSVPGDAARALRVVTAADSSDGGQKTVLLGIDQMGGVGEIELTIEKFLPPREFALRFKSTRQFAPGQAVDVALLTRSQRAAPIQSQVVLTRIMPIGQNAQPRGELHLEGPLSSFEVAGELESEPLALRLNAAGSLLAVEAKRNTGTSVLSTWQVGIVGGAARQHELVQAWPDCDPCNRAKMLRATPVPQQLGLGVDVLCEEDDGLLTLRRVTGSVAVVDTDFCLSEELDLPLDETRLNHVNGRLVGAQTQVGFAVGGTAGEIWFGETLSEALPVALERVPSDVFMVKTASGGSTLAALTDRYLAALQQNGSSIGFRRLDSEDFDVSNDVSFLASVHGVDGWGIRDDGALLKLTLQSDGRVQLDEGVTLTTALGKPIEGTRGGEAFVFRDGGVGAFFLAADDGLYFVPHPETNTRELTPELLPEPSVPIRSLALERTPLGTGGERDGGADVTRARGYLVTSRNVYEWRFGGNPARWSSTPLAIAAGEPVEVWFDSPLSALGRVGFSDGRIFTLPGGFQLANPLPGDAGTTVRLVDYENFGGWPVALSTTGLFIAQWPVENGKLVNKFTDGTSRPMDWQEIVMPDGEKPWANGEDTEGKLFVKQVDTVLDGGKTQRTFTLFLFLEDEVLKVGEFTR